MGFTTLEAILLRWTSSKMELRRTGIGEFNSDNHYIYYCGQESFRRNGVAIIVNKGVQNAVLGGISKMTEGSLFISKATHSISQ